MVSRIREFKNLTLAAIAVITAVVFVACSSDESLTPNPSPNGEGNGQQVYTMTVQASKGGEGTRALSLGGENNKTLNATWATSENVYVKKGDDWATGSLQPQEAGTSTTLKGTLSNVTIEAYDDLTLQFPRSGDLDYTGQVGTLADIAAKYDYTTASVTVASVSASGNINPVAATTTFTNQQAIIKFTLLDKANDAAISPSALTITDGTSTVSLTDIPSATYTANGASNVLYVAFPAAGSAKTISLITTVGSNTYAYETSSAKTFNNGQYYEISVKMTNLNTTPLTLEALTNGTIVVKSPQSGMKYSKNGGTKTAVSSTAISVTTGDKVAFYGNGTSIASYYSTKIVDGTAQMKAYGNIMSLVDETGYATATTLSEKNAFRALFYGNTNLTDAWSLLLPATTLTEYCYQQMFYNCTSLTTAPALPAMTLAQYCYQQMFFGCSSLTKAPVLPAPTLKSYCYANMFKGCTNLRSVTCLATGSVSSSYTYTWLQDAGTSVSGVKTFITPSGTSWSRDDSGIPSGWTRVDAQ